MSSGHCVNEAEVQLRKWLDSTTPKKGTRLPSERALSLQLGLRHYAVNRAMALLIADGMVTRDGYKLFATGGAKPTPTSLTCHLVVALRSIHIPAYRKVAKEMGIKLILHTWESIDEVSPKLANLDAPETEAVVFDPPYLALDSQWGASVHQLVKHDIPVVCVGQSHPGLFSVMSDTTQSIELAMLHLMELGHSEFGLITEPTLNTNSSDTIQAWEGLCQKHDFNESARRIHLQKGMRLKDEADEVADVVISQWKPVTALIVVAMPECNIQLLEERLIQKGCAIPQKLSLLLVGESKSAATASPQVTTVSADRAVLLEAAFFLAQRAVRKKQSSGLLPPSCELRLQSQLTIRRSTAPLKSSRAIKTAVHKPTPAKNTPAFAIPRKTPVEVVAELKAQLKIPYPAAARAFLSERPRFEQIDLGAFVNRPLNFRRGWLGSNPLKQLPPGMHEIHSVPFQILGGPKRSDFGSVIFHSAVNTTGNAQKLPDKIRIPIGCKAQAVYILHGCGYAKTLHTFAHYDFRSRSRRLECVPLVALGQPALEANPGPSVAPPPVANIQDWWPDYPHQNFPKALMAPILYSDNPDHVSRHVYLYTMEWINPSPQTTVSHLDITVDSSHSTTLGLLAVTLLKP